VEIQWARERHSHEIEQGSSLIDSCAIPVRLPGEI
jgi:hypothetical protein